jgi:hypothetical protein
LTGGSGEGSVAEMTLSFSLCWLATGLWVLADARRAQRAGLAPVRRGLAQRRGRLLRGGACLLLAGAALPLLQRDGIALGGVSLLLVLSAVLSLSVLAFPLRPRWYLASLALSSLVAASASAIG